MTKMKKCVSLIVMLTLCLTSVVPAYATQTTSLSNQAGVDNCLVLYNTDTVPTQKQASGKITLTESEQEVQSMEQLASLQMKNAIYGQGIKAEELPYLQNELEKINDTEIQVSKFTQINGETKIVVERQDEDLSHITANNLNTTYSNSNAQHVLGAQRTFSQSVSGYDMPTSVYATCKYVGTYGVIYVENMFLGATPQAQINAMGAEFDARIEQMKENFGEGRDEKCVILLHNITSSSPGYVTMGYFSSLEFYYGMGKRILGNNLISQIATDFPEAVSVIHINILYLPDDNDTTVTDLTKGYSTMVHEYQHLINCCDSGLYAANDIWWNEMMSMASEDMFYGTLTDRILEYNSSPSVNGKNPLVYTDYSQIKSDFAEGSVESVMDRLGGSYGAPYLFGQYLKTQTKDLKDSSGNKIGGERIFKQILKSQYNDYRAIIDGLKAVGYDGLTYANFYNKVLSEEDYKAAFAELNRNFKIATYVNDASGVYGFMSDAAFNGVQLQTNNTTQSTDLPGTAVKIFEIGSKADTQAFSVEGSGEDVKTDVFSEIKGSLNYRKEQIEGLQPNTRYVLTIYKEGFEDMISSRGILSSGEGTIWVEPDWMGKPIELRQENGIYAQRFVLPNRANGLLCYKYRFISNAFGSVLTLGTFVPNGGVQAGMTYALLSEAHNQEGYIEGFYKSASTGEWTMFGGNNVSPQLEIGDYYIWQPSYMRGQYFPYKLEVRLQKGEEPKIVEQSQNATYKVGEVPTPLFVYVDEPEVGTIKYQWYEAGIDAPIEGATESKYTPPAGIKPETKTYYVRIFNEVENTKETAEVMSESIEITFVE